MNPNLCGSPDSRSMVARERRFEFGERDVVAGRSLRIVATCGTHPSFAGNPVSNILLRGNVVFQSQT